jgi:carbonic anhydrase
MAKSKGSSNIKSFSTVINCIDGRVQLPVNSFIRVRFLTTYVDTITAPGVICHFSGPGSAELAVVLTQLNLSIDAHDSDNVTVVAHYNCAANPISEEEQKEQLRRAVAFLAGLYPDLDVLGLWVNEFWSGR